MNDGLMWDIRYAARVLKRNLGFTFAVVGTLALGIAATTAIASVVYAVLLRPLEFADPESLVVVWENDRVTGTQREAASLPDFWDFEERSTTVSEMAAFRRLPSTLTGAGLEPTHLQTVEGTHDLLPLLGVGLAMGRTPRPEEATPGGDAVAVLGQSFWANALGADANALGRTLLLNDVPTRVIGVLAEDPEFPDRADVWLPLREDAESLPRYTHPITVVGRLADGRSVDAAQRELTGIAADLEATYPENAGRGVFVEPLHTVLRGSVRAPLLALAIGAIAVLLIAFLNVTNLLLVHGAARSRDIAVTAALGASRKRIGRRFAAESALLTGSALLLGIVLSYALVGIIYATAPVEIRALGPFSLQLPVLWAVLAISGGAGVILGALPARQALAGSVRALAERGAGLSGPGSARLRDGMVVLQSALAVVLLVCAGVLTQSLLALRSVDLGFETDRILRAEIELPESRYPRDFSNYPNWVEITGFNRTLLDRVAAIPGVTSAALATNHPLDPGFTNSFQVVGRASDDEQGELTTRIVSSGYFATVGTEIIQGRGFESGDDAQAPMVMMLNEAAVARYFPQGDPLGQRIAFWGFEREVVGIAEDERMQGVERAAPPAMYVPVFQAPSMGSQTLLVKTDAEPVARREAVRTAIHDLDRDLAVYNLATMDETLRSTLARWSFTSLLLSAFGGVSLLLATIGVHGVLAYRVQRRSRELGIRMALGATRGRILSMVVGRGMALVGLGVLVGALCAAPATRIFAELLFETTSLDPVTYVTVAVALALAGLLASARPALHATGVDPANAMRSE